MASFGGAGGQHACEIASLLGIKTILIHRYSSILSAYGLALADRCVPFSSHTLRILNTPPPSAFELQEPSSHLYSPSTHPFCVERLDKLDKEVRAELAKQGFQGDRVRTERMLNMRFKGTDTALMVLPRADEGGGGGGGGEDFGAAFRRVYKSEFGFLLEDKGIKVDDIKVRGIGKTFDTLGATVFAEVAALVRTPVDPAQASSTHSVYFDAPHGRVPSTPVFHLDKLAVGSEVRGPAMIIDDTQTIVVVPEATAVVTSKHLYITLE